jgi:hypothetical protein
LREVQVKKYLVCLFVCLVVVALTVPGFAQESKRIYTQVGFWDVPRANWAEYVELVEKYEKPVMEKLLADGLIVEFGFESSGLHNPDGYSHASWMSSESLSGLEKALDAFYAELGDGADAFEAAVGGLVSRHMDIVAESEHYGFRTSKFENGYSVGSFVQLKPGKGGEYRRAFEAWVQPLYEKLLADGTINSYSLGGEYYHTSPAGGAWTWYIVDSAEDLDKAEAALEAEWGKLGRSELEARIDQRRDLVKQGSHRDDFTRLIYYQCK